MFRLLHNMQRSVPKRTKNLETERKFAPYFKRSAEMGGSKRAVIPSLWRQPRPLARRFTMAGAVCGGPTEREAREGAKREKARTSQDDSTPLACSGFACVCSVCAESEEGTFQRNAHLRV
jgi:hypothetical protein